MDAATALARARWTAFERILIVVMLAVFSLGIPGLGVETREAPNTPALAIAYSLAFLAPLVALGVSWKWYRVAAWAGLVGGFTVVVLTALDLAGVMAGPPPIAMVVVNVVVGVLGAVLAWRSWRLLRI